MDYDRLPVSSAAGGDTDILSDNKSGIITALRGSNLTLNRRKKDYLGDLKEARSEDGKPAGGMWHGKGNSSGLYDPWGQPYYIRLDTDGDGWLEDPSKPGRKIKASALIWSAGKDGDVSTWDDNIGCRELIR